MSVGSRLGFGIVDTLVVKQSRGRYLRYVVLSILVFFIWKFGFRILRAAIPSGANPLDPHSRYPISSILAFFFGDRILNFSFFASEAI